MASAASTSTGGVPSSSQHGGLSALVTWPLDTERVEELVVHVAGVVAVRSDDDDHDPLGLGPDSEETVAAVEVPAADLFEVIAGEAVAAGLAALILKLAQDSDGSLPPATSKGSNLAVGDDCQADFGRRLDSRVCNSAISARRSSPNGTMRPAWRSAKPSSVPSRAARSRRTRITWTRSCRSSRWSRIKSSARLVSARARTSMRIGFVPDSAGSTPASIHARTVGCEIPRTSAASETLAPRSRPARWVRTSSRARRRPGLASSRARSWSSKRSPTTWASDTAPV